MKRLILLSLVLALTSLSCTERGCQKWERNMQFNERNYEVVMYSGGDTVLHKKFHGILNQEEGSDGTFFFISDTLFELSGDYTVKSWK